MERLEYGLQWRAKERDFTMTFGCPASLTECTMVYKTETKNMKKKVNWGRKQYGLLLRTDVETVLGHQGKMSSKYLIITKWDSVGNLAYKYSWNNVKEVYPVKVGRTEYIKSYQQSVLQRVSKGHVELLKSKKEKNNSTVKWAKDMYEQIIKRGYLNGQISILKYV